MRGSIDLISSAEKYIRESDFAEIDPPWSVQNRRLSLKWEAEGLNLNRWWVLTPTHWTCSCCGRNKDQIVRLDKHSCLLGHLVEHHDHSDELLIRRLSEIAATKNLDVSKEACEAFVKRALELIRAYDPVIICEDCNNVDAKAKKKVNAPSHFSFSVRQMSLFTIANPNKTHVINQEKLQEVWLDCAKVFERRLKLTDQLVEMALEDGHWLEPFCLERSPSRVEHRALQVLRRSDPFIIQFSIDDYTRITGQENRAAPSSTGRKWAARRRKASPVSPPTFGEVSAVANLSHVALWRSIPDDWKCPCCTRTKQECVIPSEKFNWTFSVMEWRQGDGRSVIRVCNECKAVAAELAKEAELQVREISVSDVQSIISSVRANTTHQIASDETIEDVIKRILSRVHSKQ